MDLLALAVGFAVGVSAGGFAMYVLKRSSAADAESIAEILSARMIGKQTEQILQLAETKLSGKKDVIDGTLKTMKDELHKVEKLMQELERDRAQKFGQINERLQRAAEVTKDLQDTTASLRTALSSNSTRGQWGERMAEDVLRLSGLIEGVNYIKQRAIEMGGSRPDFTFLLPQNLKLNMDVKFPFNNYDLFTKAKTEVERDRAKKDFLNDVRKRIKEVQTRDYINQKENTVDYVLLFIPNEQIFSFINEIDRSLIDEAMKAKTILCSPLSLYAILAVIRQAIDHFRLENKSQEVLTLLGTIKQEWEKFKDKMHNVQERFELVHKGYEELTGTRERMLDKQFVKIEELRIGKNAQQLMIEEVVEKTTVKRLKERQTEIPVE